MSLLSQDTNNDKFFNIQKVISVMVVAGDKDGGNPVERVLSAARYMPNHQISIIPNAGHGCHNDNFTAFWESVVPFLDVPKSSSQSKDSTREHSQVSGSISVTNNGIAIVPAFSLGKPASIFEIAVRKNKFSFEPQLAFALETAKPWFFNFWLRYKLIEKPKFKLGLGFHPGFVFSTNNFIANGVSKEYVTVARFFSGEISPNYMVTKKTSVGLYYLQVHAYNTELRQLNLLGINSNFSNIKLTGKFFMRATPQIYYLKTDDKDGFYFAPSFTLAKQGLPLTISSLINKKIRSNIAGDDIVWNLSLTYNFKN